LPHTSLQTQAISDPINDGDGVTTYSLARHAHVCATDEALVFLDLKSERYLGLPRAADTALRELVKNWPLAEPAHRQDPAETRFSADNLLQELMAKGLVIADVTTATERPHGPLLPPSSSRAEHPLTRPRPTARDLVNFIAARIIATTRLRRSSLESIARRVAERKQRSKHATDEPDRQIERLADIYHRVRPIAFTARSECLLDSLILVEFLARYQLFPDWVIGVRTQPFMAHSWVEHQGRVLNDNIENVLAYTPIFSV
jgi:hypothetical protein